MPAAGDSSAVTLVLTADPRRYYEVFMPALRCATGPDGQRLEPGWLDTRRSDAVASDQELECLERGPVVLVDLEGLGERFFALVAWHARAGGRRVILLRTGDSALPFELRDLAVEPLDLSTDAGASAARNRLSTRATVAAAEPSAVPGGSPIAQALHWRRRGKNGVTAALLLADHLLLLGDVSAALARMDAALEREPDAADLHLRRALLLRELGLWDDAAHALERAVAAEPEFAPAWRELGVARQRAGRPAAEEALGKAADVSDYAALVELSGLRGLAGDADASLRLLERAAEEAGGQWNLALPIAIARASVAGRVDLDPTLRGRLTRVRALREAQAQQGADLPWSGWDAALCALLTGDRPAAVRRVALTRAGLHAPWEVDPLAGALDQVERAGLNVADMREAAGIVGRAKRPASAPPAEPVAPGRPWRASARDATWFARNVPCATACPVGTDAGTYVTLVAHGHDAEAYRTARAPNPFASVCGRVCAAPCEEACRRGQIDQPVAIRAIKRFVTERHGAGSADDRLASVLDGSPVAGMEGEACVSLLAKRGRAAGTGARVAVVGGGPAGLACAHDLAILGYAVTVFEASDTLGGMMRHGIPEYRLPRDVLDREIQAVLSLGVDVRMHSPLNRELTLEGLRRQGFRAVFLASGAGRGRDLDVEGAHLDGVVRAIDFLINVNAGFRLDLGQRVVVVGGGNVAIDVARTARRGTTRLASAEAREATRALGPALPSDALRLAVGGEPREVHIVARPPLGRWPAQEGGHGREEVEEARREGIALHPLRGVRRILGKEGRVCAVELAEVVRLTDEEGRYAPAYGPHAAETIPCDALLLAVGQEPDLDYLEGTAGLKRTRGGLIEVNKETLATSQDDVFAGGDAAFGPRTLIQAVAEGKRAARSIHARLAPARTPLLQHRFVEVAPGNIAADPTFDLLERRDPTCEPLDRRTGIAEVEQGFTEVQARQQASRCLSCHVQTVFDGERCIACGRCVDVCPWRCLSLVPTSMVQASDLDTAALLADAVDGASLAAQGDMSSFPRVAMLKDEDACIRCGLCAERCPTGAMTMERYELTALEEVR